ncbi:MAG: sugar transferase [Solirubrobacterales bacterium]
MTRPRPCAVDWSDQMELDCHYIERWSLWLDVKLIAMTAWNVLLRRGA